LPWGPHAAGIGAGIFKSMLLRLEEVHKSYGAHDVLRGVSFQVNPGEHVGIVGANGAGKTTVFRIVCGMEEPDSGRVATAKALRVGLLAQQPAFDGPLSVKEQAISVFERLHSLEAEMAHLEYAMAERGGPALEQAMHDYSEARHHYELEGGFTYVSRAETVLAGLGFSRTDFDSLASHLSGGQKARLALAKLLLEEPDLLLMDEPTNHLDLNAIAWLEEFLSNYKSAFVIISHDRFLLDRAATRIIEISRGKATAYTGNYTAYTKQREQQLLTQTREYEQQQEMIARTEEFIRRNLAGQKTKQAKSRRNMLERIDRVEAVGYDQTTDFTVSDSSEKKRGYRRAEKPRPGATALNIKDLKIGYADKVLATGISVLLQPGERLGVTGPNGSGKTTFLRTIIGQIQPLAGSIDWGSSARLGYYDQELLSLDPSSTPIGVLASVAGGSSGPAAALKSEGELRNFLARFLFSGDDAFKPISALSGGEKSRLALARLIFSQPNILVLDEPTNHLDIRSREALEFALGEYAGTIVTVSHDRYFLDKITTQILNIDGGAGTHYLGGYAEFYQASKEAGKEIQTQSKARSGKPARPAKSNGSGGAKPSARTLSIIEGEIAVLEEELAALSNQLSNPDAGWQVAYLADLGSRHADVSSSLKTLYTEWEAVMSVLQ
jgi:ATP-binding cassette subfamily F protein 3